MSNLNDNIIRAMNIILNRAGSRNRAMTHPLHASFILHKTKTLINMSNVVVQKEEYVHWLL